MRALLPLWHVFFTWLPGHHPLLTILLKSWCLLLVLFAVFPDPSLSSWPFFLFLSILTP
jgi:hypothetical protein